MKTFCWKGIDQHGNRVRGTSSAENIQQVKSKLRLQAIIPLKIQAKWFRAWQKQLTSKELLDFTRQLSNLLNASMPLLNSLEIIKQFSSRLLAELIHGLQMDIQAGYPLSEALKKYPHYFDNTYCQLVYVGEQSGTLAMLLSQLVVYREKLSQVRMKIKKALVYPATVLFIASVVIFIMLAFVVPQFNQLFHDFGAQLPLYTRIIIALAQDAKLYGTVFIVSIFIVLLLYKKICNAYPFKIDQAWLQVPLIKTALTHSIIARFARTLVTTYKAGLPLDAALAITANSCGNQVFSRAISMVQDKVTKGESIHQAMQQISLFPARVVQMIMVAEESGTLALSLNQIAEFYEQELDVYIERFTKLLEPVIMIVLGTIIGGIIAAMYLPIFRLGNVM